MTLTKTKHKYVHTGLWKLKTNLKYWKEENKLKELTLGSFRSCVTSPKWIRLTAECLRWVPGFWTGIIPTTTYNHQHINIINHTTIVLSIYKFCLHFLYTTPVVPNILFTKPFCSIKVTDLKDIKEHKT